MYSDSSLSACGGYCTEFGFWWYREWPQHVISYTSKTTTVDINILEYSALLVNYLVCTHLILRQYRLVHDPHPAILLHGDSTASESWVTKVSKHSHIVQALGHLQCTIMLQSPVGLQTKHISTKENVIADNISCIQHESEFSTAFLYPAKDSS